MASKIDYDPRIIEYLQSLPKGRRYRICTLAYLVKRDIGIEIPHIYYKHYMQKAGNFTVYDKKAIFVYEVI